MFISTMSLLTMIIAGRAQTLRWPGRTSVSSTAFGKERNMSLHGLETMFCISVWKL